MSKLLERARTVTFAAPSGLKKIISFLKKRGYGKSKSEVVRNAVHEFLKGFDQNEEGKIYTQA